MESLDLHPEELFDKAARGQASADDLARIDAHLASCATCRFERQVRADFDAVTAGTDDLDDLVARAMSGASEKAPTAESSNIVPIRRRRLAPLIAAAVALMGFGSLAAIGQFTGVLPHLLEQLTSSDRSSVPAPAPTPGPRKVKTEVAPPAAPEPSVPEVTAVIDVPEASATPEPQPVLPEPVAVAQSPSRKRTTPPAPVAPAPVAVTPAPVAEATPEIPVVKPAPTPVPVAPEPDALTLFSRAQRERVQGDTSTAIRDFRQVVARWPNTHEAALANAELGRLLLDRGEAVSALEAFDSYLATQDTVLREDVLGARALALRALGRVDAERAAWEEVLREYPAGVYAPRARARLESLNPSREP